MVKSKKNITKKEKIKGIILIILGVIGLVIYSIVRFREIEMKGGFFVVLLSIILIMEGFRIKNGKKSKLFNFSGFNN